MDTSNPNDWAQAAQAMKSAFDVVRGALQIFREAKQTADSGAAGAEVDRALIEAEKATAIAEAQLAIALGYQLCRCEYPPVKMLTVGYLPGNKFGQTSMVHECPRCRITTSGGWAYTRTVPELRPAD